MNKKLALVLGHTGGIGSATRTLFANKNILLCPVDRALIDFELDNSDKKRFQIFFFCFVFYAEEISG